MSVHGLKKATPEKLKKNANENHRRASAVSPKEVFVELFELLEEYGPAWYTPQHHQRAVAALRMLYGPNHATKPRISICQA